VPLVVTLADAGCAICPDGLGPYENGLDGVDASLDQYGSLIVDFGPVRPVEFSFDLPDQPLGAEPPGGAHVNAYLSTRFSNPPGFTQDLPVGEQQCTELNWTFTLDDTDRTQYRILFHRTGLVNVDATSFAVVTRADENTWQVAPAAAGCNTGTPDLAAVVSAPTRGRTLFTNHGTYWMPFGLTLTRQ
jgi:hypothetical protein